MKILSFFLFKIFFKKKQKVYKESIFNTKLINVISIMYLLSLLIILIIVGMIKSVIINNNTLYEILSLKDLKIDFIVKLLFGFLTF